jgi:hypothetical protein
MLSFNALVRSCKDIPSVWIFEHFIDLTEKLVGQDVRVKSIFNEEDKTPSMFIYYNKEVSEYRFKCFSTGIGGTAVDLVMYKFKLDFKRANWMICDEYNRCKVQGLVDEDRALLKPRAKFKVSSYEKRLWTDKDARFWVPFNIGSTLLNRYRVIPLSSYTLSKEEDGQIRQLVKTGDHIYGYFTEDEDLYKIYQPKNDEVKFIKVRDHVQGEEQLEGKNVLVILSSLKDILSFKSLRLEADGVASDSENTLFSKATIENYRKNYPWILTLLDIDKAGIDAMNKYRDLYQIPLVYLPLAKDLSDSVRDYSPKVVRRSLVPLIDKHLN